MAYVFTFHMFVTLQRQLHILIMFFSLVYSSPFSVSFVLHCVQMALCKLNDTKLLNCCTRSTRNMGAWSIYGNRWDYSFLTIIFYRRSVFFFIISCIEKILRNAFVEFIDRGIWNLMIIFRGQKCVIGHFFTISENPVWCVDDDFCIKYKML